MNDLYHKGNLEIQEQFNSRDLADRLNERIVHYELTDKDRDFIQTRDMFFISTVDDQGRPTVSYKGGPVGLIRVVDKKTLAFPDYDGNGMFLTNGNISANNHVGLLLIDFESPRRLRLHGTAMLHSNDPLQQEYPGAQQMVYVNLRNIFSNCPRYIHTFTRIETSKYVPQEGCLTPEPDWKSSNDFKDVLPKKV